ncbi:uncharacterized protein Dlg5l12 isoform X3 [Rattus norvegicus]|uniref:uncharacterized protein Dlg5l12 isoform X3 n=1 Tax=Rattus norvegicus TaxID=10116 RepID=UPI002FD7D7D9
MENGPICFHLLKSRICVLNEEFRDKVRGSDFPVYICKALDSWWLCKIVIAVSLWPYFRPNPLYEDLERMEEEVMSILHNLEMENTEIHDNIQEQKKEITFSSNLLSQLLMENTCRKKLFPLKQESKEVQLEWALIQKYLVDCNKNDKDQEPQDPESSGLRKCKRAGTGHTPVRELPEE